MKKNPFTLLLVVYLAILMFMLLILIDPFLTYLYDVTLFPRFWD